ncbi:MAG TPA: UDP-N-acetylmuramoyl-L-alanine--D-glutamate ligase [Fimbriimonadaceae bacterium]|nr:UDP-N-acetylmuramoyl-L-alanine--D-glutamate ligase [Fimbriimonadaceae bacterium]
MRLTGQHVAIFGLGRSGLGVARAVLELGGTPTVFDENSRDKLPKPETAAAAEKDGIHLQFNWTGDIDPAKYAYLVLNPAVDSRHQVIKRVVASGLPVLSEIEFAYRIAVAPIVAVTGTNGKSTTAVMTYLCLLAAGEEAVLCGNIFGSGYPERPLTDAALSAHANRILVAEVSSFQLEWVDQFEPVSAGITNITPDHMDRYDRFEDYAAAKRNIFRRQQPNDTAVVRANDPEVPEPTGPQVLTFGAQGRHARMEGDDLWVLGTRKHVAGLPFREPHNRVNAQMAALLAYGALGNLALRDTASNAHEVLRRAGADPHKEPGPCPPELLDGLERFRGLSHRMEVVGEHGGVTVINNSMCTNPSAVVSSLQAVGMPSHVLMGGVNKNLDFAPVRDYLATAKHRVYLFGQDGQDVGAQIGGGFPYYERMEAAFAAATAQAHAGEAIILAPGCAGLDAYRDFRERGDVFRMIAKEWLSK